MALEAELHDGTILEFPDDTPPDVVQRTVKKHLGLAQPSYDTPLQTKPQSPEFPPTDEELAAAAKPARTLGATRPIEAPRAEPTTWGVLPTDAEDAAASAPARFVRPMRQRRAPVTISNAAGPVPGSAVPSGEGAAPVSVAPPPGQYTGEQLDANARDEARSLPRRIVEGLSQGMMQVRGAEAMKKAAVAQDSIDHGLSRRSLRAGTAIPQSPQERAQLEVQRGAAATTAAGANLAMTGYEQNADLNAMSQAGSFKDAYDAFERAPLKIVVDLMTQNAPSMAEQIASGLAGAVVGGPIGFVAAGSAPSFKANFDSSLVEDLQATGIDVTDHKAIERMLQDPLFVQTAIERARKYAAGVTAVDAASMGLATKSLVPKNVLRRVAKAVSPTPSAVVRPIHAAANLAAQVPVQAAMGAGSEVLGQVAKTGEVGSPGEVIAEAVAEAPGSVGEVLTGGYAAGRDAARRAQPGNKGQIPPDITPGNPPPPTTPPRGTAADLEAVLSDPRPLAEIRAEQDAKIEADRVAQEQQARAEAQETARVQAEQQAARTAQVAERAGIPGVGQQATVAWNDSAAEVGTIEDVFEIERGGQRVTGVQVRMADGRVEMVTTADARIRPPPEGDGTRTAPVKVENSNDVVLAAAKASTDYTPEQGEANNIPRGHLKWQGLDGTIEVAAGGERSGTNPETGEAWSTTHTVPYGYWKGTEGADGMHVDVYFGPDVEGNNPVFVIDEIDDRDGSFRQHKTLVGFPTAEAARAAYLGTSSKKSEHIGSIQSMTPFQFKNWLKHGDTKKPIAYVQPQRAPASKSAAAAPAAESRMAEAPTPTRNFPPAIKRPAAPIASPVMDRAVVDGKIKTISGRSIPAPNAIRAGKGSSNAKVSNDVRKVDAWLHAQALAEAQARGDDFNVTSFGAADPKKLSQADKEGMNLYLFGEEYPTFTIGDSNGIPNEKTSGQKAVPVPEQTRSADTGSTGRGQHEADRSDGGQASAAPNAPAPAASPTTEGQQPAGSVQREEAAVPAEEDVGALSDKEIARRARMKKQAEERKRIDLNKDSLMDAVIKSGGISMRDRNDVLGDPKANSFLPFVGYLFSKTGIGLDIMAQRMVDLGYLTPDEAADKDGVPAMVELLRAEYAGAEPRKAGGIGGDDDMRAEYEAQLEADREMHEAVQAAADEIELFGDVSPEDLTEFGIEPTPDNIADQDLLSQLDEATVERLAMQHPNDVDFFAAVRKAVEERQNADTASAQDDRGGESDQGEAAGATANADTEEAGEDPNEGFQKREAARKAYLASLEGQEVTGPEPYDKTATGPSKDTAPLTGDIVPLTMPKSAFEEITDEWAALFEAPDERVNLDKVAKAEAEKAGHPDGYMPVDEARAEVEKWIAHAEAQGADPRISRENANKTVLSLYDLSGQWSQPWRDAGYNVITMDIQTGQDVNEFSREYFEENWDISDVYAILIAQPCTDFAVSGARHFAAKDKRGDTKKSIHLVHQSLRTVEYFRPKRWTLENPVSRIENMTGLPPARLTFNPNNFGEPYTKKTVLWGNFDPNLPTANVDPVEGSKMWAKYGGKSLATKNARSVTPEGFAYAYFMANNYEDTSPAERLAFDFPEVSGAVKTAFEAGVTEERIRELMEDTYGNYEYDEARDVLIEEVNSLAGDETKPDIQTLKGDRFTDDAGNEFEVWSERGGRVEAFPVVNGKVKVSRDDGQIWAITAAARSRLPDARTDFNPKAREKKPVTPQVAAPVKDGFEEMLAKERAEQKRRIDLIGEVDEYAIVKHTDPKRGWQIILPNASGEGGWRTQSFDENGFFGHDIYKSKDEAIKEAAISGFYDRDDGALDRIQDTSGFQRGLAVAEIMRKHNTKQISWEQATEQIGKLGPAAEIGTADNFLQPQTKADLEAKDERANDETAETKAIADRERDAFTLTAQAAPEKKDTTGDMFGAAGLANTSTKKTSVDAGFGGGLFSQSAPATSAKVAKETDSTKAQIAEVERILDFDDRAVAAEELGAEDWSPEVAKQFLSRYAQWLQDKTKETSEILYGMFERVLFHARNGLLSFAVAINMSAAPVAPSVDVKVTPRMITIAVERPKADFKGVVASADAQYLADHLARSGDGKPFIVADKKAGLMYAFTADGALIAKSPGLFGKSKGDYLTVEQQNMAVGAMTDKDKITPAGIFKASLNPDKSYGKTLDFAQYGGGTVSIHRVYLGSPAEKRAERLASESADDNRVSYGCINALPEFMEQVVEKHFANGGTVAVLPDSGDAKSVFDLPDNTFEVKTVAAGGETESVSWGSDKYPVDRKRAPQSKAAKRRKSLKNLTFDEAHDLSTEELQQAIDYFESVSGDTRGAGYKADAEIMLEHLEDLRDEGMDSADQFSLKFKSDIPSEEWLQDKVDYAKSKGRDRFGAPYFGTVTGSYSNGQPVQIKVSELMKLKGLRGEQENVRQKDLDAIKKIMQETGKLPLQDNGKEYAPFVMVAHNGEAWVSEGNHRIMAAAQLGWDTLPVEVRYFDGGERNAKGAFSTKRTDQTDTPAFRKWFGDSKVYGSDGQPKVMYHGTNVGENRGQSLGDFDIFDRLATKRVFGRESLDQTGSWFTDNPGADGAAMYAGHAIYPVYLSIKKPYTTTFHRMVRRAQMLSGQDVNAKPNAKSTDALREWMKEMGYDGIHLEHDELAPNGSTEFKNQDVWVALEPEQIKSAIGNNGDFDATNPSIVAEPERGYVANRKKSAQDTADEVSDTPRANQPAAAQSDQLDLFAAAPVPSIPGGEDVFGVVVEPAKRGTLRIGFDTLDDPDKAAHAFAALRKSPREVFQLIVLDKDMRPIASWDLFKGTVTQTSVYPREVISAAYSTPGAAYVWYAHNHPSGVSTPSQADEMLTQSVNRAGFTGSGVEFLGHIIITADKYVVFDGKGGRNNPKSLTPASRKFSIPILERTVKRQKRILPNTASSPREARDVAEKVSKGRTGLILLDAQHGVSGWVNMSVPEMAKLKTGDVNTGAGKLFKMVSRANPAAVIIVEGADSTPGFKRASQNIASAFSGVDVQVLDSFFIDDSGRLKSSAELGESLHSGGTWLNIEQPPREIINRMTLTRMLRDHNDGPINRIHITKEIRSLTGQWDEGKLTPGELRNRIETLAVRVDSLKDQRARNYSNTERERGADIVREKLLRARRRGELPHDTVELALWLLDKNPDVADDLGISVRASPQNGRASGNYNPLARIITLFKGSENEDTAAHEILHHTERMMPDEIRDGITKAWAKAFAKAFDKSEGKARETLLILAEMSAGMPGAIAKFRALVDLGQFDYDLYQFTNPSEYWAVNGSMILRSRATAEDAGWISQARQWLTELREKIKDLFGLVSDAAVIRALDNILGTDGTMIQPDMLNKMSMAQDIPKDRPPTAAAFAKANHVRQWVADAVFGPRSELNGVQRTLGDMYGTGKSLEKKGHPEFLRVFWKGQDYLSDQAGLIKQAQDLAPDVIPGMDTLNPFKALRQGASAKDMLAVGKALYAGTLFGGATPLQGRRWNRDELLSGRAKDGAVSLDAFPALTERQADYYQQVMRAMADMLTSFGRAMLAKQAQVAKVSYDPDLSLDEMAEQIRERVRDRKAMLESMAGIERPLPNMKTDLLGGFIDRKDGNEALGETPSDLDIVLKSITSIVNKTHGLIQHGYFPLMRFGKYFITVRSRESAKKKFNPKTGEYDVDEETGKALFFGRFESFRARNAALRQIREEFPDEIIVTGEMPKSIIFEGLNLDMLELFADKAGLKDSEAYQSYLKMATFDHSAMKRFIQRQGTAGFDENPTRVLASFLVSTARNASGLLNLGDMLKRIGEIPKSQGVATDMANNLYKYLSQSGGQEEWSGTRAYLAHDMLLGTLAGGMVNMTQVAMATLPELSGHIGAKRAASEITKAAKIAIMDDPKKIGGDLGRALAIAENKGWTEPQEVYLITAVASDRMFSSKPKVAYALKLWGFTWSAAEIFNRRTTFIAAYNSATKHMGMTHHEAIEFGREVVTSTQGAYNKGNRPEAFRGIGTVVFQFQIFKVVMLSLLKRLPWPARLMLLGMLWLASGVRGLPFYKDIDDVIATFWQWAMGGAGSPDKGLEEAARSIATWSMGEKAGKLASGVLMNGISEVMPFDIASRLGLGDIIPGTGALRMDNPNGVKSAAEVLGVAASKVADMIEALALLAEGKNKEAAYRAMPRGVASYAKAVEMAIAGKASDSRGGKVMDVDASDVLSRFVGFNPAPLAAEGKVVYNSMMRSQMTRMREKQFIALYIQAEEMSNEAERIKATKQIDEKVEAWNRDNPDYEVDPSAKKVNAEMDRRSEDRESRILKSAPKGAREATRREFQGLKDKNGE